MKKGGTFLLKCCFFVEIRILKSFVNFVDEVIIPQISDGFVPFFFLHPASTIAFVFYPPSSSLFALRQPSSIRTKFDFILIFFSRTQ